MNTFNLLKLIWTHPSEVTARFESVFDSRLERIRVRSADYECSDLPVVTECLWKCCELEIAPHLSEPAVAEIENEVKARIEMLPLGAPFAMFQNGDFKLARLAYALCRARRPQYIIETGVCYGVTTAFLLKAIERNGCGELHSIDLPALGKNVETYVGALVPSALKGTWRLHRGTSKTLLPKLLKQLGYVDMFIHDSLHTYRNMRREFQTVTPFLRSGAVVLSDDVECNAAFSDWTRSIQPRYHAVLREESKPGLTGLLALS